MMTEPANTSPLSPRRERELSAWFDAELTPDRVRVLCEDFETDDALHAAYDELQACDDLLDCWAAPKALPDVREAIRHRVQAENSSDPRTRHPRTESMVAVRTGVIAAAGLALGFFLGSSLQSRQMAQAMSEAESVDPQAQILAPVPTFDRPFELASMPSTILSTERPRR